MTRRLSAVFLLVLIAAPAAAQSTDSLARVVAQAVNLSDAEQRRFVEASLSGVVLIGRQDAVLATAACGYSNRDHMVRNQLDTKFHFASMGKMFTAIAIAQLVQAGRLSLDDTLAHATRTTSASTASYSTARPAMPHAQRHRHRLRGFCRRQLHRGRAQQLRSALRSRSAAPAEAAAQRTIAARFEDPGHKS